MVVDDEAIKGSGILNKKLSKSKNPVFLTVDTRQAFIQLKQTFTEVLILNHFDLERHIWIETDISSYTIGGILSQLTLDFGQ